MTQSPTIDLTNYIERRVFGERPHIRGRRIPIATLAFNARTNRLTVPELAHDFGLTEAEVLAALLYYEEHRAEIDGQEQADQAEFDALYEQHSER